MTTYAVLIKNAIYIVEKDNLLGENINPNKYINKPIAMYYLHNGGYIQSLITGDRLPIVEGIETEKQVEFAKKLKCDIIQGYYYSKPISKKEFEDYFKKHKWKI